jgi:hypothetical protein
MDGEKRLEIERELLLAIEQTKSHYQALLCEATMATEIVREVGLENSD